MTPNNLRLLKILDAFSYGLCARDVELLLTCTQDIQVIGHGAGPTLTLMHPHPPRLRKQSRSDHKLRHGSVRAAWELALADGLIRTPTPYAQWFDYPKREKWEHPRTFEELVRFAMYSPEATATAEAIAQQLCATLQTMWGTHNAPVQEVFWDCTSAHEGPHQGYWGNDPTDIGCFLSYVRPKDRVAFLAEEREKLIDLSERLWALGFEFRWDACFSLSRKSELFHGPSRPRLRYWLPSSTAEDAIQRPCFIK